MAFRQFSLRLMLAVVTALCIALSVWSVPAERQRRVVAAIERAGGYVNYVGPDETASGAFPMMFLRRSLPPDYFDEVISVNLANTRITDAELVQLQQMTSLQSLVLSGTQVTDAGLVHPRGLTDLQNVFLCNVHVTDAGLAHLQGLTRLRLLDLDTTRVTDAGLVHLQGLTSLRDLYVHGTQVTEDGVARLQKALPRCEIAF